MLHLFLNLSGKENLSFAVWFFFSRSALPLLVYLTKPTPFFKKTQFLVAHCIQQFSLYTNLFSSFQVLSQIDLWPQFVQSPDSAVQGYLCLILSPDWNMYFVSVRIMSSLPQSLKPYPICDKILQGVIDKVLGKFLYKSTSTKNLLLFFVLIASKLLFCFVWKVMMFSRGGEEREGLE